ncbi:MAG: hypothetical protein U5N58_10150 [Actinomycetota bacterium]|nr:hypothetical protein [Actinomycetota bacterium]
MVLKDRRLLSRDGIIIAIAGIDEENKKLVNMPEFVLKGVVYLENFDDILNDCKNVVT